MVQGKKARICLQAVRHIHALAATAGGIMYPIHAGTRC